ncbi:MAG: phosphoenolpyruvate--protein phosphotransferase [Planctomycetia bacterium]|nr:phosphoenolpyruvate--protein phosphotransferase [Planctomycetia bacterium]
MKTYQGIAVSSGITIGAAMVLDNGRCRINRRRIEDWDVAAEVISLDEAFNSVRKQLTENRDSVSRELGNEYGQIFEAHLMILADKRLRQELETYIREQNYSAEYAVNVVFEHHADLLRKLQSGDSLSERANDILDIEDQLLCVLMGVRKKSLSNLERPVIILAPSLTPSETANVDRDNVLGIGTETGGLGSHTAIVAAALQSPAILGIGQFLNEVNDGDIVIIDGKKGHIIVNPDVETITHYEREKEKAHELRKKLAEETRVPVRTIDGADIAIYGNIEFPYEAKSCMEHDAAGIGLYRTEFLYLAASPNSLPDEEVHFNAYKEVAETMKDRIITIRTFDLGADKLPNGVSFVNNAERNPFMGLRSIRLSLRNTSMFRKQLRAILRASVYGKFRIMFPLISNIVEFRQAKMIVNDVAEELYEAGIPYDSNIPLGIMVEVPSTVIMLSAFVREVDFFSIGTNDLCQYTLAVDRSNKDVCGLYNTDDPALVRLIQYAIRVADHYDKPISLCGQMSSNPIYTMLLLGLGLRHFSVSPYIIPEIKEICLKVSLAQCKEIVKKVFLMETSRDIRSFLKRETERLLNVDFDE